MVMLVTALSPVIGYDRHCREHGRTIPLAELATYSRVPKSGMHGMPRAFAARAADSHLLACGRPLGPT
jgi:hypothetical protein